MPRLFRHIMVITLVGGLLAGCGDEGDGNAGNDAKADDEQVRAVAEAFTSAAVSGDYEQACSLMTSEAQADLLKAGASVGSRGGDCTGILEAVFDIYDEATKAKLRSYEVTGVQVSGNTATFTDNTGDPSRATKKGGRWLIDSDPPQ